MAQQLWFLRHGEAEPHEATTDSERELTPRGERQARDAGTALARLGMEFAGVFSSPKVRSMQTAQLACESLGLEPVEHKPLASGFDIEEARTLMAGYGADDRVLVVGHEPDFSQTVHDLAGGRVDMKKGGIVAVALRSGGGEILVVLRPRELETLAGD